MRLVNNPNGSAPRRIHGMETLQTIPAGVGPNKIKDRGFRPIGPWILQLLLSLSESNPKVIGRLECEGSRHVRSLESSRTAEFVVEPSDRPRNG